MEQKTNVFKKLPKAIRRKLREDRLVRSYIAFTEELCEHSFTEQIEADCEYMQLENDVLAKKASNNNTKMIALSNENIRLLGEALEKVPRCYWEKTSILPAEIIISEYEEYKKNPPQSKPSQLPLEVQQCIISFALDNMLWGINTIINALRNVGYSVSYSQARTVLKNNHIPMARERKKLGVSWRDFLETIRMNLKNGVIVK